jgi:hypothetical protein
VSVSHRDANLREVQAQMKQLQLKVVGRGVQIANKTFQSFEDVKTWVNLTCQTIAVVYLWMEY